MRQNESSTRAGQLHCRMIRHHRRTQSFGFVPSPCRVDRATTPKLLPPKLRDVKVIEVYADVWCPFAHVGLRCVVERRAQLKREDVLLDIRAWPLELVNEAPLDPETTAHHVQDLKSQVAPDLFRRFEPRHFPKTTLPALACAHAAYTKDMKTGEAVSLALRHALFEEGLDISRLEVLSDLVESLGVDSFDAADERAVLADWHEGAERGVKGSPHFYCGDSDAFCPSLEISKDGIGHLKVSANLDVLDAFLTNCFER
jgi:predicted DsbA family dithiol-disulfide isomerase